MGNQKWLVFSGIAVCGMAAVYFAALQGVSLEVNQVASGTIEQYVEDTGTVKSHNSQTVYLESSGTIARIFVEKGDSVAKGALLLKLDPTDLRIVGTEVKKARNDYEMALKDWEKNRKLYSVGAISQKEYDAAEAAFKNADSAHQAALLQLGKASKSTLVRAPRAGVILDRLVEPNDYASTGAAAFVIGDLADLEIEAQIPAEEAVFIRPGNRVNISGKATGNVALKGKVATIAPMAKSVVSSLGVNEKRQTVKINFTGAVGQLKPGADIDIKVITVTKTNALKIPLSAVFDYKDQTCVFAVENGKTKIRPIVKGIENDDVIEVKAGLKSGELILTRPDNTTKEGLRVKTPRLDNL